MPANIAADLVLNSTEGFLSLMEVAGSPAVTLFDNRPTWDNPTPAFDNRPTWDDWSKKS
ncbi:multiple cyclophane-containing RiPP AmcA [Streptomyces sp. NPDC052494]|uniref:multiple cyclophane-containing RiPP AmcA n=1 Tax=Streptomyces sp. NPDC052494 TaxID=3365692 RepID=UPI0037D7E793